MDHLLRSAADRRHITYRVSSANVLSHWDIYNAMNWRSLYRGYRSFAFLFHLGIFLMVFLAILPVAIKSTTVENVGDITWSFDGKRYAIMSVPVTIKNSGVYDIDDIHIFFKVRNSTATFVDSYQDAGDISAGSRKTIVVRIPVDLQHIYELEEPTFYHFFNYDTFDLNFSLSLRYLLDFVDFNSQYIDDVRWEPIVKDFTLYHPSGMEENGTNVIITIPYSITTASYLKGTAAFRGNVTGDTNVGSFYTEFTLGRRYEGTLRLVFNVNATKSLVTHSQILHLSGEIDFEGFKVPMHTDYAWGAPLNNLQFEVLNNGTLHYSFQNDADFSLSLLVEKDYYYNGTLVYHEEERMNVEPGENVSRYEAINVNQPVDRVVVTITDENTGIQYVEVIDL